MTGPLQPWERAAIRILVWGGIFNSVVFTGTVNFAVVKVLVRTIAS